MGSDYNFMIPTVASVYCKLRTDQADIDALVIECTSNGQRYDVQIEGGKVMNRGKEYSVSTDYKIGDFVFESAVNNEKRICQIISKNSEHEVVIQFKGLKHVFL